MAQIPPTSDSMQRTHKPPKCFIEDEDQNIVKKKKSLSTPTPMLMPTPMMTQSSTSTTSSAKSRNKKDGLVTTSPPCAQRCAPKDAAGSDDNDPSMEEAGPNPIEVSDDDSDEEPEDAVIVVEDDEEELGEHNI
jgi:hypothetical protein